MPLSGGTSNATPIGPLPTVWRSFEAVPRLSGPIALVSGWARPGKGGAAPSKAPNRSFGTGGRTGIANRMTEELWGSGEVGTLYVVATPIGHLSDLGVRAAGVLRGVDVVAAEDTRTSRVLLER